MHVGHFLRIIHGLYHLLTVQPGSMEAGCLCEHFFKTILSVSDFKQLRDPGRRSLWICHRKLATKSTPLLIDSEL
jgi:hypothetical protein